MSQQPIPEALLAAYQQIVARINDCSTSREELVEELSAGQSEEFRRALTQLLDVSVNRPFSLELRDLTSAYELRGQLGSGGSAVVYRALQKTAQRDVALKVLLGVALERESPAIQRFLIEVGVAGAIAHENVVRLYECGLYDGRPCLVIEFIDGESLQQRFHHAPAEPHHAARLTLQIARGIEAAHRLNVAHRDLKASNVLLDSSGRAFVTDFGIARDLKALQSLTKTGERLGTVGWISPEQARGDPNADPKLTDMFGLGAILHFLVAGEAPFAAETPEASLKSVLQGEPNSLPPTVPLNLRTLCDRCLAHDPRHRLSDVALLIAELERYLNGEPIRSRPTTSFERLRRWCQRRPLIAGLSACVFALVLALIIGGWWTAMRQSDLRQLADAKTEHANRMTHKEELTRYQSALQQARRGLDERRFNDSLDALNNLPPHVFGWEGARIKFVAASQPMPDRCFSRHDFHVLAAVASPDEKTLVTSGADGMLLEWDVETATVKNVLRTGRSSEPRLRNFHFALDRVLDPKPEQRHDYFTALTWVGSSSRLLGATTDGKLVEFDLADRAQERLVAKLDDELLTLASNGETLLVAATSGSLQLRANDGSLIQDAQGGSPAIAVLWCDAVKSWLIGREDGHLEVRDAHDLKVIHEMTLPGPVWSIDSRADDDQGATLIVGCEQPSVRLMQLSSTPLTLQTVDVLSVPSSHRHQVRSIRAVRFLRDGQQLLALDNLGRLSLWSLPNRQLEWLSPNHLPDPRRGSLQQLLKDRWGTLPFPIREDRAGILLMANRNRVLTFGLNMVVNEWQTTGSDGITQLACGPEPKIQFDATNDRRLWCLDRNGFLSLIDSETRTVVSQTQAHELAGTACVTVSPTVMATSSLDGTVRFWSVVNDTLHETRPAWKHSVGLLDLAISGSFAASIDVESRVMLWDLASGRLLMQSPLRNREGQEASSGHVAINSDGTRLAACGSGPACDVFSTASRQRVAANPHIFGNCTALAWDAQNPSRLLVADDSPSYLVFDERGEDTVLDRRSVRPEANNHARGLVHGPNGRLVAVEKSGRLRFIDLEHVGELTRLETPSLDASSLAFDVTGKRLAVARSVSADAGAIDIYETSRPSSIRMESVESPNDRQQRHAANGKRVGMESQPTDCPHPIITPQNIHWCVLTASGELRLALNELDATTQPPTYRVVLWSESAKRWSREVVYESRHELPRGTVGLRLDQRGSPLIVFRENTGTTGPYDSRVLLARREPSAAWHIETIMPTANAGYFPFPALRPDGSIVVWHYSFAGYHLCRTFFDEHWQTEFVGHQGDGHNLMVLQKGDGLVHLISDVNRNNADTGPPIYMQHDGDKFLTREIIDVKARFASCLSIDGPHPMVLVRRPSHDAAPNFQIRERHPDGWRDVLMPEIRGADAHSFALLKAQPACLISDPSHFRMTFTKCASTDHWKTQHLIDLPDQNCIGRRVLPSPDGGYVAVLITSDRNDTAYRIHVVRDRGLVQ